MFCLDNRINMKESENFSIPIRSSEKSFGILFSIVFLIVALYPLTKSSSITIWALTVSLVFLALALFRPKTLTVLNILWAKFGKKLGAIMAPIIIFILFILTIVPTSLLMKLFGRDLLNRKLDKTIKTYWIKRDKSVGSMKNQF